MRARKRKAKKIKAEMDFAKQKRIQRKQDIYGVNTTVIFFLWRFQLQI